MHLNILNLDQAKLLPLLEEFGAEFGLVGGTAIALQLGHRRSIDFDFFKTESFSTQKIQQRLRKLIKIDRILIDGQEELTLIANRVKLTFYLFPFPITFTEDFTSQIKLPSLLTLSAMKAVALGKRGKWKDYVDLYFLLHQFSLAEVVKKSQQIFGTEFNEKLFRVQLSYYTDVDKTETVDFLPGFAVTDAEVEKYLTKISLT